MSPLTQTQHLADLDSALTVYEVLGLVTVAEYK